jgi:hypothetical protein
VDVYPSNPPGALEIAQVEVFAEQPFSLAEYSADYIRFLDHPLCMKIDVNEILGRI